MGLLYVAILWGYPMGLFYGVILWGHSMGYSLGSICRVTLWGHFMGLHSGVIMWGSSLGSFWGVNLWGHSMGLLSEVILWAWCLTSVSEVPGLLECHSVERCTTLLLSPLLQPRKFALKKKKTNTVTANTNISHIEGNVSCPLYVFTPFTHMNSGWIYNRKHWKQKSYFYIKTCTMVKFKWTFVNTSHLVKIKWGSRRYVALWSANPNFIVEV